MILEMIRKQYFLSRHKLSSIQLMKIQWVFVVNLCFWLTDAFYEFLFSHFTKSGLMIFMVMDGKLSLSLKVNCFVFFSIWMTNKFTFQGMVEATSGTTQARASYLPGEIQWGKRFKNVITRGQNDKGTFHSSTDFISIFTI